MSRRGQNPKGGARRREATGGRSLRTLRRDEAHERIDLRRKSWGTAAAGRPRRRAGNGNARAGSGNPMGLALRCSQHSEAHATSREAADAAVTTRRRQGPVSNLRRGSWKPGDPFGSPIGFFGVPRPPGPGSRFFAWARSVTRRIPGICVPARGMLAWYLMRSLVAVSFVALTAVGCSGETATPVPAYLATDSCHMHADEASCVAAGPPCAWVAIGAPCPSGTTCPVGACIEVDPCAAHGDATTCDADTAHDCGWAGAVTGLCPAGATCPASGGFCTRRPHDPSGCACACPLYCPAGGDCPPCVCDCNPGGCPAPTPSGCACACPACQPGQTCPPCVCDCPEQPASPPVQNACTDHQDQHTCADDSANHCAWIPNTRPCRIGEPCPAGTCYQLPPSTCP